MKGLKSYHQRKQVIEQKDAIEELAAAAIASTDMKVGASITMYNSYDCPDGSVGDDVPSFMKITDASQSRQNSRWNCNHLSNHQQSSRFTGTLDSDDSFRIHIQQDNCSEADAMQPQVKRHNLIEMFLKGTEVDEYIMQNLYGRERAVNDSDSNLVLGEFRLGDDINLNEESFANQMQLLHKKCIYDARDKCGGDTAAAQSLKVKGLSAFQTYIALIKGYCGLLILVLPKSFSHGGYLVSPVCIILCGLIQMIAANKLVQTGKSLGLKSYSMITEQLLGHHAKMLLDFMIAAIQFIFTVSWGAYVSEAWRGILFQLYGLEVGPWTISSVLVILLTRMAWVRDLSKLSIVMLIGNLCILSTLVMVSFMMVDKFVKQDYKFDPNIVAFNKTEFWSMVGFCCYTFEGIGVVMPIMHACECPDQFPKILLYAFATLIVLYCVFANWTYLVMGPNMTHPFITEDLDQSSSILIFLNLIMSIMIICSYAIVIYPTNTIIEECLFSKIAKRANNRTDLGRKYQKLYHYLQNFSRFLVCLSAIFVAIALKEKMDKFLSLLGALLCAPLAILYPALLHLVGPAAESKWEKLGDVALLAISLVVMAFSTIQCLSTW